MKKILLSFCAVSILLFCGAVYAAGHDTIPVSVIPVPVATPAAPVINAIGDAIGGGAPVESFVVATTLPAPIPPTVADKLVDEFDGAPGAVLTEVKVAQLPSLSGNAGIKVAEITADSLLSALVLPAGALIEGNVEYLRQTPGGSVVTALTYSVSPAANLPTGSFAFLKSDGTPATTLLAGDNIYLAVNLVDGAPYDFDSGSGVRIESLFASPKYQTSPYKGGGGSSSSSGCDAGVSSMGLILAAGALLLGKRRA